VPLYSFRDVPRQLSEYEEMSTFHQTSPDSGFTKGWICSKATRDGHITLANGRLIVTAGDREESMLGSNDEVRRCLRDLFAIEFDDSVDLSRLDNSPKS
jgi:N-hydroxyarylamine O-acetyltransferase